MRPHFIIGNPVLLGGSTKRDTEDVFENGVAAFGPRNPSGQVGDQHRIAALEQKLQRMNHVLAVLMEEYAALKEHATEVRKGRVIPSDR